MDLRSVLNTADNGDAARKRQPPPQLATAQHQQPQHPQHQQHPQHPQLQHPQHPQHPQQRSSVSPAQYGYREYPQAPQPPPPPPSHAQSSPARPAPPEYPHAAAQQPPPGQYMPPQSPYQTPGPYPPRSAQPPPLQSANSFHDPRSPSGSVSVPPPSPYRQPPSPYRQPPTPSAGPGPGAAYPFPPTGPSPEVASPLQRHQYPPAQYATHQGRDSYAQGVAAHAGPGPYMQQHPVPQTPPVATPGAAHPYLQQRSQSTQSTPTPTSAHSQHHQYGPPYTHGSPVSATQGHLPPADYNRQPSQPPTPLGPPLAASPRQSTGQPNYAQPPSPYQQRTASAASAHAAQAQASPRSRHPPIQRMSSTHSTYESPASDTHQRSFSHREREQSLSVSPKTRVPSLASSAERPPTAGESDPRPVNNLQAMAIDSGRAVTPAKRKLDDRDLSPRDLERREVRPPPGEKNGAHVPSKAIDRKSASPAMPHKTRIRRTEPPVWAQSARSLGKKMPNHANFVLQKKPQPHVNGKRNSTSNSRPDQSSRNASPEATRPQGGQGQPAPPPVEPGPQDILGPWEASITGVKPLEEASKTVADFLFLNVVNSPDSQEILSRGIQFEIEAKLGTLIDKDTNHRVSRLIDSECILHDNGRTAFRSSMTEAHHKAYNEFLNQIVIQTDPRNPNGGNRVQVHYKHRREIDRFFELPLELQNRLPGCMRSILGSRSKNVRVRVTYDQKTQEILSKIIKARVADIDLHLPMCPMDCRISVNLEMDWDGPVEELQLATASQSDKQPDRNKDRLSYTQGHYQIDLTQVTQTGGTQGGAARVEKEHELEIEVASAMIVDQGRKALNGAPHRYQELVEGLLDNVRVLARKAKEFA